MVSKSAVAIRVGSSPTPGTIQIHDKRPSSRVAFCFSGFAEASVDVLGDAPQHAGRVIQTEILHSPGLGDDLGDPDAVAGGDPAGIDVGPPGRHIFHQDVHHEVLGQLFVAMILQQEAHLPEMEIGDPAAIRGQGEAEILIELFGQGEVAGRHEGLDFGDVKVAHEALWR